MTVYLVGAGPGDPGLFTRKGAAILARADVVVFDRLVPAALVDLAPDGAELLDVGKSRGKGPSQAEITAMLVDFGRSGRCVVRLKGGDPFLFGRGGEEALALREAGVAFEIVPGVTSALAAPAYAGIPVTHRGTSTSVTIVTGQIGVNLDSPEPIDWDAIARVGGTIVVLMGMANRKLISQRLIEGGRSPDTAATVIEWATTSRQRSVRTTLVALDTVELEAPSVIVVGPVSELALTWFENRPLHGKTVVVTRSHSLSAHLQLLGASVIEMPVSEVVTTPVHLRALAEAVGNIANYDWVVFTSANAVSSFMDAVTEVRCLSGVRIAAVGEATAAALATHRITADLVPAEATADNLVDELLGTGNHLRVLYPCAAEPRPVVVPRLTAAGWSVDAVESYRTMPLYGATLSGATPSTLAQADVIAFASPSAVTNFMACLGGDPVGNAAIACIGPATADAATQAGLHVDIEAAVHSAAGLADAIARWFDPTSSSDPPTN